MRTVRRLLLVVVFVALLVTGWRLAGDNAQEVTVHYVFGQIEAVPIWLVVLAAFLAGAAVVALLGMVGAAKLRLEARRYRKAVRSLEAEVHQLRNLPLTADEADVSQPPGEAESPGGPERGS
jgi:uncharacterized integral membrane protein